MYLESRADSSNTTILPSPPIVVSPDGKWDGDDGKWSTFMINVGDSDASGSGQNFRVLPFTSSSVTLVPQLSKWCTDATCAAGRGIEIFNTKQSLGFDTSASKSWTENGLFHLALPNWWSGSNINGTWGWDNVGLGASSQQSPIMPRQMVVGFTDDDLYMGSFGLSAVAINTGGGPQQTFLQNIAAFNKTPSVSYGYTAGAYYQNNNKGVLGNLVLGGYDQSRLNGGLSIPFISPQNQSLIVGVQSIIYHPDRNVDANDYSLTSNTNGFLATIDSTLPFLWLPDAICDQFAQRFQLTYNSQQNLYTVNSSAHDHNMQQNSTVTFKIGAGPQNSNDATTITLPYAAFDLGLTSPLAVNATPYFPLRKSPNGQYVLGRSFLQESYLIVDYERFNFTVAPAFYSDPMPSENVVSIFSTKYVPPKTSQTPASSHGGGGGLSGGAIAGIVVGILVVLALLGLGGFIFWKREHDKRKKLEEKVSEIDTTAAGEQVKHRRVSELDSEPPGSPKASMGGYYDKDTQPFPPINEMESPPAELYSPPPDSVGSGTPGERHTADYFFAGTKMRRRGATRESSGNNTPGTPGVAPIAELPGDDGNFTVNGQHFERVPSPTQSPATAHSRDASNTSLPSNIDEVIANNKPSPIAESESGEPHTENHEESEPQLERRTSHARGPSDTTVQSDTTAVSQPTPEERADWDRKKNEPRRPLSE